MRCQKLKTVSAVYNKHVLHILGAPRVSTFRNWVGAGTKFSSLAGAGKQGIRGFYSLILMF